MMFFMSCKTTKMITKVEYYVPEINFPNFPKLENYEKLENDTVKVDGVYLRQILIFREKYKSEVEKYKNIKEKLGGIK